ncbi:hypothetical protein F4804DRAFT_348850 [Jackrogersella minutella]|nr:hypothetical protein F4804DRAFT_348850 [Jackrogersella minutella]
MTRLNNLLLVGAGLSAPAIGAALPALQSEARHCTADIKVCRDNVVFWCNPRGQWVGTKSCQPGTICREDKKNLDAACVKGHGGIDTATATQPQADAYPWSPAPTPAPTLDPATAFFPAPAPTEAPAQASTQAPGLARRQQFPPGRCTESQLRCNGAWEEVCDAFGAWQQFQQCSECLTTDGSVDCIVATATATAALPPPTLRAGDQRCNGNTEEIYDDASGWEQVSVCAECFTYEDQTIDCVPFTAVPAPTAAPTICRLNELRCNGNFEEICNAGGQWTQLLECYSCTDVAGAVECVPNALPPQPTAAPVCEEGRLRCGATGNSLELCNAQRQWQQVEQCAGCSDTDEGETFCTPLPAPATAFPTATAAPTSAPAAFPTATRTAPVVAARTEAPSVGVAVDDPCFGGEVKCSGDRVSVCTSAHKWEDFGPCPNCKQLYNTRVNCDFHDAAQASNVTALLAQFTAAFALPASDCEQGRQRCANNNATVEACGEDGKWAREETCAPKNLCVGVDTGIAFCLDKEVAEHEMRKYWD